MTMYSRIYWCVLSISKSVNKNDFGRKLLDIMEILYLWEHEKFYSKVNVNAIFHIEIALQNKQKIRKITNSTVNYFSSIFQTTNAPIFWHQSSIGWIVKCMTLIFNRWRSMPQNSSVFEFEYEFALKFLFTWFAANNYLINARICIKGYDETRRKRCG